MRKQFTDLNKDDLWALRGQIVLNSLFVNDYKNTFGFKPQSVCAFFDGYVEYLWELATEDGADVENMGIQELVAEYDNADALFDYYWECDDYSWVEYSPEWTEEEITEYEKYYNGTK